MKRHWVRRTALDVAEQRKVEARRLVRRKPSAPSPFRLWWARVRRWFERLVDGFKALGRAVIVAFNSMMPVLEPVARASLHEQLAEDLHSLKRRAVALPSSYLEAGGKRLPIANATIVLLGSPS